MFSLYSILTHGFVDEAGELGGLLGPLLSVLQRALVPVQPRAHRADSIHGLGQRCRLVDREDAQKLKNLSNQVLKQAQRLHFSIT